MSWGPAASCTEKTLSFEYELASGKLTLLDQRLACKPLWASISPDEKTVIFARNHDLYMMDAENYAKALKDPNDKSIVETQLTKDGEEDFGYGSAAWAEETNNNSRSPSTKIPSWPRT